MSANLGNLSILGSTGSIGLQTLDVVRRNPELFRVVALSANQNVDLLARQAKEFLPEYIAVGDEDAAKRLSSLLGSRFQIGFGTDALVRAANLNSVQTVVISVVGFSGIYPLLGALAAGKHIALANKESLVACSPLVKKALQNSESLIVPVDSEHNSIFQCLYNSPHRYEGLRSIVLTASGGPFWGLSADELDFVTPVEAVRHPRWSMGSKISVDSATLMNKGLEVIEASALFDLSGDQIGVVVHPQSIIHGLIEYCDGSVIAALFEPDMRVPISYALGYLRSDNPKLNPGKRIANNGVRQLDLVQKGKFDFYPVDFAKFPALRLCFRALELGNSAPAVVNAANEIAVQSFISEKVRFTDIPLIVEKTLDAHQVVELETAEDVIRIDTWARESASKIVSNKIK